MINKLLVRLIPGILIIGAMLFLPAGTLNYWQAWVWCGVLFLPMIFVFIYFLKKDPALLERRIKIREKEKEQSRIMKMSAIIFFIAFLIPGFDFRFGWSYVPVWLIILSDIIILLSYGLFFLVLKENSYAARVVEVEAGQKLVDTGPYSIVRHPMYVSVSLIYIFTPLALGSFWALLFFAAALIFLIPRIFNEEKVLLRDLPGYSEYMKKVKFRLIPGVW